MTFKQVVEKVEHWRGNLQANLDHLPESEVNSPRYRSLVARIDDMNAVADLLEEYKRDLLARAKAQKAEEVNESE